MKVIELRRAALADLPFLLTLEQHSADLGFVGTDPEPVHRERLESADCAYFVIEHDGQPAGYAIVRGLEDTRNGAIELKRLAVSQPGAGIGREALRQLMRKAFGEWNAHRLWLDVFTDNVRARHVYQAMGFVEEGTMRECVFFEGRRRSLVLMSMLAPEYAALLKNF